MSNPYFSATFAELFARSEKGELCATSFLTPAEQKEAESYLKGKKERVLALGGYEKAERRRLVFLPEYFVDCEEETKGELLRNFAEEYILPVKITGSGYRELTHRDFLGALMGLGVERDALGDLVVLSPKEAVFFTSATLAAYFKENLTAVGADTVHAAVTALPADFNGGVQYEQITDTVASPRLDAVVASLCSLSREGAQALLKSGAVQLDYQEEKKPDRLLAEGQILVIRGKGKYTLRSLSDKTKKGRYRLVADKRI